ncbi:MFS transporter [Candidatus Entotheonella palauensis]|uniref:MFS transporter n=1 Tax=Candidatus Entotheonella palauensis TaxID=93172 RepID=UPI0015C4202F|nr:MFS transporter [Candidatus Entotheonella palauensis]
MDRYGTKWLLIVAMAIFGIGVGLISLTQSLGYLLLIVVISYLLLMFGVVYEVFSTRQRRVQAQPAVQGTSTSSGTRTVQTEQEAYRWVILAVTVAMAFMITGSRSTLGVFFKSIVTDLGWDRGMISMIIAVNIWLSGFLQPFTGNLMDRYGPKWIFIISMSTFGLGIGLISMTQSFGFLLFIYGIVVAAAMAGSSNSMTNALVAKWFPSHQRGLAIGINNAGSAVGQLTLVWFTTLMLQVSGWRSSHIYLGLAIAVITVPLTLLIPRRLQPASSAPNAKGLAPPRQAPLATERWTEALNTSPLWLINAGYFVCGMTVSLYITHLIPFATDQGYSPTAAASAFGLLSVCSAAGSLLSGYASDIWGRKNIMALAYFVRGLAFVILLAWRHEFSLYVFAILGGLSWLATPVSVMALTSEVYGMRNLATLGGVSLLVHQIGGGVSVWLAGELHDLTGSYDVSFTLAMVALFGATVASYLIDERRYSMRYATPVTSA